MWQRPPLQGPQPAGTEVLRICYQPSSRTAPPLGSGARQQLASLARAVPRPPQSLTCKQGCPCSVLAQKKGRPAAGPGCLIRPAGAVSSSTSVPCPRSERACAQRPKDPFFKFLQYSKPLSHPSAHAGTPMQGWHAEIH